jgi:hypothetical protein
LVKVALIGTHNTGKTTALWQIGAELKKLGVRGVGLVQETVRGCPYPIEEKETFEGANWTLLNQILAEADAQLKYRHVICDRSVIDQTIYFECVMSNVRQREYLRNIAKNWMAIRPYNHLFMFTHSPLIPVPRKSSLDWRIEIEKRFLVEFGFMSNASLVFAETLEERVAFVLKKILQEIEKENENRTA